MTFTDDDLKRLKTMVLNCEAFYGMNTDVLPIRLSNLLARLEAAEAVIYEFKLDPVPVGVVQRWRKAAGK